MIFRQNLHRLLAAAAMAPLLLGGGHAAAQTGGQRAPTATPAKDGENPAKHVPATRQQITLSFAPVVRRVKPAVVNIRTVKGATSQSQSPFDHRFYGNRRRGALGSGVIVRPDGLIVTNYHVIRQASRIRVILSDKREFEARILLKDQRTDLAILKIDPKSEKLPTIELRDSDDIEVGDLVLAIGNPFGVGQTVTSGIVSALARTRVGVTNYRFFIQTDAAINPGNSGGALVTMDGRLIGINTAIYSRTGGSVGIGFAIPANMVRRVIATAAKGGKSVERPWLGVSVQPINANLAKTLGMKTPTGVIVLRVVPGSPAQKAGLRVRDVILRLNGRNVVDAQGLKFRLGTLEIGGTASLSVVRNGKPMTITFQLAGRPDPGNEARLVPGRNPLGGAFVANLTEGLADDLNIQPTRGVVVTAVRRGSISHRIGLRRGDIVLALNTTRVSQVADVFAVLRAQQPGEGRWFLMIRRGNIVIRRSFNLWSQR